jgi:hypothetical protein
MSGLNVRPSFKKPVTDTFLQKPVTKRRFGSVGIARHCKLVSCNYDDRVNIFDVERACTRKQQENGLCEV